MKSNSHIGLDLCFNTLKFKTKGFDYIINIPDTPHNLKRASNRKYFLDTNALLNENSIDELLECEKFYISSVTVKELENIKTSSKKDDNVKYLARKAVRYLSKNEDKYEVIIASEKHCDLIAEKGLEPSNDNLIIACAYDLSRQVEDLVFVTGDLLCKIFAKDLFGLDVQFKIDEESVDNSGYKGYRELFLDMHEENDCKLLAKLYKETTINHLDMITNEYLVVRDKYTKEVIDKLKWYGDRLGTIRYKQVSNKFMGKIKPRNTEQELLFDLLQDDNVKIKLTSGIAGSGKDICMLAHAINLINQGKYRSLVYIRPNHEVRNTMPIGHLPGELEQKMMPFLMPIADHVGGQFMLESMLRDGTIQALHLGHARGRSISKSIIYCTEIENMTKEHIQLIMTRVAEDSVVFMNGDLKQVDKDIFKSDNGMKAMINKLSGNKNFGFVELQKTERSEIARMAQLLD